MGISEEWRNGLEGYAIRHTLACLLARVAGRSPLEYMTPQARERQRQVIVALMHTPPPTMEALITAFVSGVGQ